MAIRILDPPESAWGDYGDILRHGMSSSDDTAEGVVELERTGPYVPPITFPGSGIVVTDDCRKRLVASGLTGFTFKPVQKARIVDLPWHTWNLAAAEPAEYPRSGEPEDYVFEREHSPALAEAIGTLWQMIIPIAAETERESAGSPWDDRIYLNTAAWTGADFFQATGVGYVFVSDEAQNWLMKEFAEHVSFRDCLLR
jgi:hypothetical protein